MRPWPSLLILVLTAPPALAQSEVQLRAFFEGKSVRVRIEMPGAEEGVDVYPGAARPIDFPRHASRLKEFGTALRRGDEVLITKLKVKRDLIEFQLGGGGYGTSGDDVSSTISVPSAPKTTREKNLAKDLERASDPAERRRIREELDALKRDREREDARNRATTAQAQQAKEASIRQRRLEGGSRFNLRFAPAVPNEALMPEWVMRALDEYVDFSSFEADPAETAAPRVDHERDGLRKGLTLEEVDAMFGRPEAIARHMEGNLTVSTSSYRVNDRRITAEFVEGVLIRFTVASP